MRQSLRALRVLKIPASDTENYRNGYTPKIIKTSSGPIQTQVPRDRNGEFEPKLIRKHQTVLDEI